MPAFPRLRTDTPSAEWSGYLLSAVLARSEDNLDGLEVHFGDGTAGNRDRMATESIQAILVEIVAAETAGTTKGLFGDSPAGPNHGFGKSIVGCAADTW